MARKSTWNTLNPTDTVSYPAAGRIVLARLQRRGTPQVVEMWLVSRGPDREGWRSADDFSVLKDTWDVVAWSATKSITQLKRAPLDDRLRYALKLRLADLKKTAAKKGTTLDAREERAEQQAGKDHFELGCWLYFYSRHIGGSCEVRADCLKRIFMAGLSNPGYDFFTAFDFGERQFDSCLEQGDSKEVIALLRKELENDTTGHIARAFDYFGWAH